MNKPSQPRPLGDLVTRTIAQAFEREGFASTELVARWPDIVGPEIAAHAEPARMQWPRRQEGEAPEPATLVLRVEGPAALEIQHLSAVIIERVNRFFGWRAVGRIALRQAPLVRRSAPKRVIPDNGETAAAVAAALPAIENDELRAALGRLGAAVKRT